MMIVLAWQKGIRIERTSAEKMNRKWNGKTAAKEDMSPAECITRSPIATINQPDEFELDLKVFDKEFDVLEKILMSPTKSTRGHPDISALERSKRRWPTW